MRINIIPRFGVFLTGGSSPLVGVILTEKKSDTILIIQGHLQCQKVTKVNVLNVTKYEDIIFTNTNRKKKFYFESRIAFPGWHRPSETLFFGMNDPHNIFSDQLWKILRLWHIKSIYVLGFLNPEQIMESPFLEKMSATTSRHQLF